MVGSISLGGYILPVAADGPAKATAVNGLCGGAGTVAPPAAALAGRGSAEPVVGRSHRLVRRAQPSLADIAVQAAFAQESGGASMRQGFTDDD